MISCQLADSCDMASNVLFTRCMSCKRNTQQIDILYKAICKHWHQLTILFLSQMISSSKSPHRRDRHAQKQRQYQPLGQKCISLGGFVILIVSPEQIQMHPVLYYDSVYQVNQILLLQSVCFSKLYINQGYQRLQEVDMDYQL